MRSKWGFFVFRTTASATIFLSCAAHAQTSATPATAPTKSCTRRTTPLSPADLAFSHRKYTEAAELYEKESQAVGEEGDRAHLGRIRALLHADKLKEAEAEQKSWLAAHPESVWPNVAKGEVAWRNGRAWEAIDTFQAALTMDTCNAWLHADFAKVFLLSGMPATAAKELTSAHKLDPVDDTILARWTELQPRGNRLAAIDSYLKQTSSYLTDTERKSWEHAKDVLSNPPAQACRLATSLASTSIPFHGIQDGPRAHVIWGLDVAFNGKPRRLEIDTGASGLLLTKAAASALHLEPDTRIKAGGIGDDGTVDSFIANVKSIKIGSLEFENCDITILSKNPHGIGASDGLIGGDVFASFLLTLDFPGKVLKLDPLPPLPNVTAAENIPRLATGVADDEPLHDRYIDPSMASWTKVFRSGKDLILPVRLNEGPDRLFIVDSGGGLNLISEQAAREVTKVSATDEVQVYGISGKVAKTYMTDKINLDFAHMRYPADRLVAIDTSNLGRNIGIEIVGLLGVPILHQLTVRIDYRDNLVNFTFDPKRLSHCVAGMNIADCY